MNLALTLVTNPVASSAFRYVTLGSGSRGNATVISAGGTRVLLDCGFQLSETLRRLSAVGLDAKALDAILVTHEHADHLAGVAALAEKFGLPVYMTAGTRTAFRPKPGARIEVRVFTTDAGGFDLGPLHVTPFTVPHDAREPAHFTFAHQGRKLGVLSDAGHVTPHMKAMLTGCDALMLEFNHDRHMLLHGPYPEILKRRVGGGWGHLSNGMAADFLTAMDRDRLRRLTLTHLSEKNNTPEKAREAACVALDDDPAWCVCAAQDTPGTWHAVGD